MEQNYKHHLTGLYVPATFAHANPWLVESESDNPTETASDNPTGCCVSCNSKMRNINKR